MIRTVYTFCFILIVCLQTIRSQNAPVSSIANVLMTGTTVSVPVTANNFTNIGSVNYTAKANPSISRGGVNSTDAIIIKRHTVGLTTLSGLPLKAGDVNKSNTLNSTDALLLQLRFIGTTGQFSLGDWVYGDSTVIVSGNAIHNIQFLAAGDVNQSYSFSSKEEQETINFKQAGEVYALRKQEIDVAIGLNDAISMAALSMEIFYDRNKIDILSLTSALKDFKYSINNGIIRIAWAEPDAVQLHPDETLISLKVIAKADIYRLTDVFTYSSSTEIADKNGYPIVFNTLKISSPQTNSTISEIALYPNPCNEMLEIEYSLNETAIVNISIYNTLGERTAILEDTYKAAGKYHSLYNSAALKNGIYKCEIIVKGHASEIKKNFKFVKIN